MMNEFKKQKIAKCFSKKFDKLSQMGGDIRRIFMLGQKLKETNPDLKLIDLSLGNPDLDPPQELKKILVELINSKAQGNHRYMDAAGLIEVRQFLADRLSQSEGIDVSANSVYLSVGAAGALQILFRTFLDPNDEVIIFAPYFPEYIPYTQNFGAKPVIVKSNSYHIPILKDFEKKISHKTKLIVLNSPNNPAGIAYHEEVLQKIIDILEFRLKKYNQIIQIISDEPYYRIIYDSKSSYSLLKNYPFTWIVRSFSKDLGLAGERIGFIAWKNDKFAFDLSNVLRNSSRVLGFVSAPRLMQRLIPHAYNFKVDVAVYQKRVFSFIKILEESGVRTQTPDAGFFVFPKSPYKDDRRFCEELVNSGVLCVPGSAFGCPGYFRASLTQSQSHVEEAARRIANLCKNLI